jgi:hypothetical protein
VTFLRSNDWSWKRLRYFWLGGIGFASGISWALPGLLRDWGAAEFGRALQNGSEFTIWDWNDGQYLRHRLIQPLALAVVTLAIPAILFAATRSWFLGHATLVRALPRPFRSWIGGVGAWLLALWLMIVGDPIVPLPIGPANGGVPILLAAMLLALQSHLHPRSADFDARNASG